MGGQGVQGEGEVAATAEQTLPGPDSILSYDGETDSDEVEDEVGGLPKNFIGDSVSRDQCNAMQRTNNNKGEVVLSLADRYARRFQAAYPNLQQVIKLSKQHRQYLDSLSYDHHSESPTGDGRSYGRAIRHTPVPLIRLAVEGPPGEWSHYYLLFISCYRCW